jgi:transcriptional regulator with XRE-family HTH domain
MNTTTTHDRVAANVRAELVRKRISAAELARRMGVSPHLMSRRLRGDVAFSAPEIDSAAEALGIPVDELLGRTDAFWKEP